MSKKSSTGRLCRTAMLALSALAGPATSASAGAEDHRPSRMEQLMIAAGFQAMPGNTPERRAELLGLKPKRLVAHPAGEGFTYVYADPRGCACLYMGDADDYAAYQKLAVSQRIADTNAEAASDARFAAWNWNTWGPYDNWWWDGPLFTHRPR